MAKYNKKLVHRIKNIIKNCSLTHLDLSSMMLGRYVFKLAEGIEYSKTLMAVHLSENEFTKE